MRVWRKLNATKMVEHARNQVVKKILFTLRLLQSTQRKRESPFSVCCENSNNFADCANMALLCVINFLSMALCLSHHPKLSAWNHFHFEQWKYQRIISFSERIRHVCVWEVLRAFHFTWTAYISFRCLIFFKEMFLYIHNMYVVLIAHRTESIKWTMSKDFRRFEQHRQPAWARQHLPTDSFACEFVLVQAYGPVNNNHWCRCGSMTICLFNGSCCCWCRRRFQLKNDSHNSQNALDCFVRKNEVVAKHQEWAYPKMRSFYY